MKKILALILTLCMVLALCACGTAAPAPTPAAEPEPAVEAEPAPAVEESPEVDIMAKSEGVMTYADFAAAEEESEVVVETFVQAKEGWWDGAGTVYTQDADGGYFLYQLPCTEEEYAQLVPGQKIKVTGYKSSWEGEVEIVDASFELEEGSYIAPALDVTELFGTDQLIDCMNRFISVKGLVIAEDVDSAWDASADLEIKTTLNGKPYSFFVRRYLTGNDSETYAQVKDLKAGDVVDVEAFLYWYNAPQARIVTAVTTGNVNAKSEGVMTYADFAAAEEESEVVVETYVQAKEGWWDGAGTVYTQDADGGYFLYQLPCTEEEYAQLVPGQKIKVTGYKSSWEGEVEIVDASFELEEGSYIAPALDVTELFGTDQLIDCMNRFISVKGLVIAEDVDSAWDASADLEIKTTLNDKPYSFFVRRYLTGNDSETYAQVKDLKAGDVVDVEAFLYWYNAPQARIITAVKAEG